MKKMDLKVKLRRACQGHSPGFTLIEVVIAIALIGLIGAAVLSALSTASLALIIADQRATAESLARTQMEYVKSQNYTAAADTGVANYTKIETTDFLGYSICSVDCSINGANEPVNCGPNDPVIAVPWDTGNNTALDVDNGLQKVKLVIKHDDDIIVVLEDYKRNPEALG